MLSLSIAVEGGQTTPSMEMYEHRDVSSDSWSNSANEQIAEVHRRLLSWYEAFARDLPWRRTSDPYAILVSEVLLQQTQVHRVIPKYQEFLGHFPTIHALATASVGDVIRVWAPLGYNRRAVNLHRLANEVERVYCGTLPQEVKDLQSLPGIGPYTAAAVACFGFARQEPVVDTNVRRVLGRLCQLDPTAPHAIEHAAASLLPAARAADWNQALMDLGATICKASSPSCGSCPLNEICPSSGRVVRETRVPYSAAAPPFHGSNRYLRGRIVDLLRSGETLSLTDIATALQLVGIEGTERLKVLLEGLRRDSLVVAEDGRADHYCLPQ